MFVKAEISCEEIRSLPILFACVNTCRYRDRRATPTVSRPPVTPLLVLASHPTSQRAPPADARAPPSKRQRQTEKLSRGYFPRAVFFFSLGFLVLPVLAGAASFFGRFGDTCSLLPWLAVLQCLRARARSEAPCRAAGRSARRYRSASPPFQSTEPSPPRPETAMVNGCCKRARPAKVARRCVPVSLSRATAAPRLSEQTTRQEKGSASTDQATRS